MQSTGRQCYRITWCGPYLIALGFCRLLKGLCISPSFRPIFPHPTLLRSTLCCQILDYFDNFHIWKFCLPASEFKPFPLFSQVIMSTDPSQFPSEHQNVPKPTDQVTGSGTEFSSARVTGATKTDGDMLQFYINMVAEHIKKETNPTRRQNIQVCLEYTRQHGYPAQGYRFFVHQGVMEVLTEDQYRTRRKDVSREVPGCLTDVFGLVCCCPFDPHNLFGLLYLSLIFLARYRLLPGD